MKMMNDDSFRFIAESHKAFMDLAQEYMDSLKGVGNDFKKYAMPEDPWSAAENEEAVSGEMGDMEEGPEAMEWADSGSDPYGWEPHFNEDFIEMLGLDCMAGGYELGLPEDLYINNTPRGIPDHLLLIANGKYIE